MVYRDTLHGRPDEGDKGYAVTMFYDYLFSFNEFEEHHKRLSGITYEEYLHLHSPAVEWLSAYVGQNAPLEVFTAVLQRYNDFSKSSMVLKHIIDAFEPAHYTDKALALVALVKQANASKTTLRREPTARRSAPAAAQRGVESCDAM